MYGRRKSGGDRTGDLACHVMDMLQLYAVPQLPGGTIYQQDGAPPHFANIARTFLDEQFCTRCIGRGSPYIECLVRSPVLNIIWFFLWGFVKDQAFRTPVCNLAELQERIYSAAALSHQRCIMTHGSRFNTGWTFPMSLIEAMLRFMEHEVKKIPVFHSL